MFKNISALLFDLDGTLLDSFPVHLKAYMAMFRHFGLQVSEEDFLRTYSPDWFQTYIAVGLPRELWTQADTVWLEEAARQETYLFPKALDTLSSLGRRFRLGLVTSGSRSRVERDLKTNGITGLFEVLITGSDIQRPKPDPQGLFLALEKLRLQPEQAVYIGDTVTDFEMAQAAGIPFIGIPSQFGSLKPDTPCCQVGSLEELCGLVE